ncbi:urease accessory protein UreF [Acidovorax sp. NCPPB 4044]|uniref:urease accessory protein UreF n=1 Tax=Acidovorax sp. NCPPB 4044 TaxID=2940490 RepID=UPI00230361FD|nr:urease accessory UreF family protein [Acidovorax sp. NCPPB 4044]MDA8521926.1 urease accessory protein UreF [Acidovorax sp. NCPPB 4044]
MAHDAPAPPPALPAASLLQLIWLASPALPVGGFSYSEGLEIAVERAGVTTEAAAAEWLQEQLHLTQARGDMAVVHQALAAWRAGDAQRVRALNDWVRHTRETSELRLQTEQMGRSLADWLRNQHRHAGDAEALADVARLAALPPTYPVAFALAAARTEARSDDVLLAYAFGWAENMVQAALKAVPLGQSAGQRILAQLASTLPRAVAHAIQLPDADRQAFSPMLAVLSAQHETQYSRLFRS